MLTKTVVTMNRLRRSVRFFHASAFSAKRIVKWSNEEPMADAEQRKKNSRILTRQNWESALMFGPLLKSRHEREKFAKAKRDNAGKGATYSAVFNIKESGYRYFDRITPTKMTSIKTRITASPTDCDAMMEMSVNAAKREAAEPKPLENVASVNEIPPRSDAQNCDVLSPGIFRGDGRAASEDSSACATRLLEELKSVTLLNARNDASTNEGMTLDKQSCEMLISKSSGVSTILQKTMSEDSLLMLELWKRKMVHSLGEEGFQKYQQEMFRVGSCLHRCIEDFLSGVPSAELEMDDSVKGHWRSLQPVLADISDVLLLETRVHHPVLQYRGVLDGVVNYRGTNMLIEWKTSQRPKPNLRDTYDNPLQAAAYIGALNYSENLKFQLAEAAIVVAYPCGTPAHVHFLNKDLCHFYWNLWLQRFAKFLSTS